MYTLNWLNKSAMKYSCHLYKNKVPTCSTSFTTLCLIFRSSNTASTTMSHLLKCSYDTVGSKWVKIWSFSKLQEYQNIQLQKKSINKNKSILCSFCNSIKVHVYVSRTNKIIFTIQIYRPVLYGTFNV